MFKERARPGAQMSACFTVGLAQPSRSEDRSSRFRLQVCRKCDLVDARFDPLLVESDELVRVIGKIVHNAIRQQGYRR